MMSEPHTITHPQGALHEQFDDLTQQREASKLGMWTFLATEILFFGGMFTGYIMYRAAYPRAFHEASHHLYMWIGAVNTAILLTSSLTMAMAVHAASLGRRRPLLGYLGTTLVLGIAFLGLKIFEYNLDWDDGLVPGIKFDHALFPKEITGHAQLFYMFYFFMTGLHAIHMIMGIAMLIGLMVMTWRNKISPENHNPVEIGGLYWHFVDVIWIFLFPLLYLIGI